ncbi:MAG: UDP-N-acetylglucosamine 2-epimerase [Nitrosarchaeum sp.]|nr:UDP-N-acetylglucosamine 2-epimerase [Nitrosarchaeum sp.]
MKVCFVYSNRSEYAELKPFIEFFKKKSIAKEINLSEHIKHIEDDENLPKIFTKCFKLFSLERYSHVCVLGDRRELPFVSLAGFFTNTKIVHIAAGEYTESTTSYDQYIRPIISILSSTQICFSKMAQNKVKKLFAGIEYLTPNSYVLGNPVFAEIDIKKLKRPIKERYDLVLIHPQSLSRKNTLEDVNTLKKILKNKRTIFIQGNKDRNSDIIEKFYRELKIKNKKYQFVSSFPKKTYFSHVKFCDSFFTNTSAVHEIDALNKNCLHIIGKRNKNRSIEFYDDKSPLLLYNILKKQN